MFKMIEVFNQLTSTQLADCNTFKTVLLDEHFLKFRHFYHLIGDIDIKKIDKIDCEIKSDNLILWVTPSNNKYVNDIMKVVNNKISDSDLFITDISNDESCVYIDICICNDEKEGDIYGNRHI